MPKPNPLTQGLSQTGRPPVLSTVSVAQESKLKPPSRAGRVLIGGHFAPEVQTALKIIAAEERTTIQSLLSEAINTVFAKRQKPQIAEIPTE